MLQHLPYSFCGIWYAQVLLTRIIFFGARWYVSSHSICYYNLSKMKWICTELKFGMKSSAICKTNITLYLIRVKNAAAEEEGRQASWQHDLLKGRQLTEEMSTFEADSVEVADYSPPCANDKHDPSVCKPNWRIDCPSVITCWMFHERALDWFQVESEVAMQMRMSRGSWRDNFSTSIAVQTWVNQRNQLQIVQTRTTVHIISLVCRGNRSVNCFESSFYSAFWDLRILRIRHGYDALQLSPHWDRKGCYLWHNISGCQDWRVVGVPIRDYTIYST